MLNPDRCQCDPLVFSLLKKMKDVVHSSSTQEHSYEKIAQKNECRDRKFVQSNYTRWVSSQDMIESGDFAEKSLTLYTLNHPDKIDVLTTRKFRATTTNVLSK